MRLIEQPERSDPRVLHELAHRMRQRLVLVRDGRARREHALLDGADRARRRQRPVLEVRADRLRRTRARARKGRVLAPTSVPTPTKGDERRTPGPSWVSTAAPGKSAAILCAFATGETGSAVFPTRRTGKLVRPPMAPANRCAGRIFHPLEREARSAAGGGARAPH
jgi:hypothetical protein